MNTYIALLIYRLCDHSEDLHNTSFGSAAFKTSFTSSRTSDGSFIETIDLRIFRNLVKEVCDETNVNYGNIHSNRFSLDNSTESESIHMVSSIFVAPDESL